MCPFLGVVRYEYRMAIRRWGVWLAFALAAGPYVLSVVLEDAGISSLPLTQSAGSIALSLNFWLPVVAGIAIADRLPRDRRLGVTELLAATPLTRCGYVLGKYAGNVLAVLTPVFGAVLLLGGLLLGRGAPLALLPRLLAALLIVQVPAYLFVGAFSLACPAVLPVRAYQVLYTGYWFWGNYLSPKAVPTLAGTLLEPSGEFAASAFFHAGLGTTGASTANTIGQAVANLAVLAACAAAALVALERYLAWQARQA